MQKEFPATISLIASSDRRNSQYIHQETVNNYFAKKSEFNIIASRMLPLIFNKI